MFAAPNCQCHMAKGVEVKAARIREIKEDGKPIANFALCLECAEIYDRIEEGRGQSYWILHEPDGLLVATEIS